MGKRVLLSANEAAAWGAYAAGVKVAAAYPGTPSTEILENISAFKDKIRCEWSVNEKVAMEVAIGASIAGERALTAMKHVGLNVAMDPIMTYTYVGPNGGLVIFVADDPGMHSSQNEQDTRNLAKFMRAVLLEPADSQEAFDMTRGAFPLSEAWHVPVIIRLTTRTSHTSTVVDIGADELVYGDAESKGYAKDIAKTIPVPLFAKGMRLRAEIRTQELARAADTSPFNRIEPGDSSLGIITCGVAYQYVKEAFPEFTVLKLGMPQPFPKGLVRDFAAGVKQLLVIEELDPVIEDQVRALGIATLPHTTETNMLELNADRVAALRREILADRPAPAVTRYEGPIPSRPPVLCAGCSHRGVFYTLNKLKATVTGDIGCYTLGAFPPLSAMDTVVCMGACIGNADGMKKAGHAGRIAAVIGDSTFFHSGLTGITNVVYNKGAVTTVVLDNRITGMTGHQDNPGSGKTLMGEEANVTDIAAVCTAIGVKHVYKVDAYDLAELERVLTEALDCGEPAVVIAQGPCLIAAKMVNTSTYAVDPAACKACGACFRLGCPAIIRGEAADAAGKRFKAAIDPTLCSGCDLCRQLCSFKAIAKAR